ncbi:hypothetical protein TDMWS_05280 [Thermodesulfomicrobium sp. WS]|jgi:septal ring factor EnvC (AmiA/AmiB activator)|uniref:hypothetical protein n=1 Tax=Thermodesulfomicrobium sp. WS TaxID=3004129 RepID=UPI002490DAF6|nr:hypothetical protein [Thermodesulfomicrobium sp. WS]BDV00443.1 hypothetical protein TDMWS_05280 [Thermodesulfomicrobium sp. WS]
MDWPVGILLASSVVEVLLAAVAIFLYLRLRQSEALIRTLQERQSEFMEKLAWNTRLEQELVASFAERQEELARLDAQLTQTATHLRRLLQEAERYTKSPEFLRHIIVSGRRRGQSPQALAQSTGLTVDEVELILESEGR